MTTTPALTLGASALATASLAALAIADQMSLGWTRSDVSAHYGPFGEDPDPRILTTVLASAFVVATILFATAAVASLNGWGITSVVMVALLTLGGVGFAALATFSYECDGYVLITFWRFASWVVPVMATITAVTIYATRK